MDFNQEGFFKEEQVLCKFIKAEDRDMSEAHRQSKC